METIKAWFGWLVSQPAIYFYWLGTGALIGALLF